MKGFILSRFWYFVLSFTWGLLLNIIGVICGVVLRILGYRPERNIYGWVFRVGKNWGGVNLGVISIVCIDCGSYTLMHEFGHSIQVCIFGPFVFIFVVIPSVTRYWYRRYLQEVKGTKDLPNYDYAWFEGQATMFGQRYKEAYYGDQ